LVGFGTFRGYGDDRKIVVFANYDDLGLSFLSLFLGLFIYFISSWIIGMGDVISIISASIISTILFAILWGRTYRANNENIFNSLIAFVTKLTLSFVWLIQIINILNPIRKDDQSRKNSKIVSSFILLILTPILGKLVVDKRGSKFNPFKWIEGEKLDGVVREHL
jgi:uncharacterized protein YhhL (DUF1145 family)